jgi:hypothetical protein
MHAVMKIAHQNPLLSVAQKAHTMPTTQTILSTRETTSFGGGSMSRAYRKAGVHDDAIIAFLLVCLEIYQAEQQRRRKLH